MRLAEVQRRVRDLQHLKERVRGGGTGIGIGMAMARWIRQVRFYRDTLRTLLDHDLPDDARQLIEAALEAER